VPTIDFTTFNEDSLRDFKPVLAKSYVPEWWKSAKVFNAVRGRHIQTIRACPAMDDWLKSGWYILANRDMEVNFGRDKESTFTKNSFTSDPNWNYDKHHREGRDEDDRNIFPQYHSPSHPAEQFYHSFQYLPDKDAPVRDAFKMRSAWNIKTPPGYSCLYLDPFLFQNEHFAVWQGIIDTDSFQTNYDNSQIIFYPRHEKDFIIPKGTPLVQIVPFRRENWVATYQCMTEESWTTSLSEHTNEQPYTTMTEWGRTKYDDKTRLEKKAMGPYRNEGYWQEKGKMYKEEGPPPECPFHEVKDD